MFIFNVLNVISQEQLNQVLDAMFERKTQPDEHVIDQGDDGDNFYVIDRGIFDIYVKIDGADKMVSATYNIFFVFPNKYLSSFVVFAKV